MLSLEERQAAEIAELRKFRDEFAADKTALEARIAQVQAILSAPINGEEADVTAFGRGVWVYCNQHRRPHLAGWCSVSPRDKVGLGAESAEAAYAKCKDWGFDLYSG